MATCAVRSNERKEEAPALNGGRGNADLNRGFEMLKGDRVQSPSYGVGTIVEVENWYRGEPVARVRFDAFVGTRNDRPITTPLAGLTAIEAAALPQ